MENNEIEYLKAIPSEMQVVKMLYDRGCVLNEVPVASEWRDIFQRSHIDVVAYLPKYIVPGYLLEFKIDAKSHYGKYNNIFLETQTRPDGKGIRHPSWAFSAYQEGERDITRKNRYLADVLDEHDGISFRQTIDDLTLIDTSKQAEENARSIINYYSSHMELLDHDIIIYSFEDINSFLTQTGGNDLTKRTKDSISKKTNVKYITCEWDEWDKQYGRYVYSFDKTQNKWCTTNKGQTMHKVEKLPFWRSIGIDGKELSEIDNEIGMEAFISSWKEFQKNGLTYDLFVKILGYY